MGIFCILTSGVELSKNTPGHKLRRRAANISRKKWYLFLTIPGSFRSNVIARLMTILGIPEDDKAHNEKTKWNLSIDTFWVSDLRMTDSKKLLAISMGNFYRPTTRNEF